MKFHIQINKVLIGGACVLLVLVIIAAVLLYPSPSTLPKNKGVVVSNGPGCATVGKSILEKNGSAVDAAIATLFCEGVTLPNCLGLGGGFLMTIYDHNKKEAISLNAREVAPMSATQDMFAADPNLAKIGALSIAVPGQLSGFWEAHQRYGILSWPQLIEPTIKLCANGINVTSYLAFVLESNFDLISKDAVLRKIFIDENTNKTLKEGDTYKMIELANTLNVIATEGGNAINNGSLTEKIVREIQEQNGIITADDLINYKPLWQTPVSTELPNGHILYSAPLPGSGAKLSFILNLLNGFLDISNPDITSNWQRIVESFKFAYGRRTNLGDLNTTEILELVQNLTSLNYAAEIRQQIFDNTTFQSSSYYGGNSILVSDRGTAHVSVLSPNGDAVSVTSTINFDFGSGFTSPSTGIIFNNQMDDFSLPNAYNGYGLPPSAPNYIEPGKHPMSSMSPSIIVRDGIVEMIAGGAGGSRITTSVSLLIIKHLWFGLDLDEAMADKRLHHQLIPMEIQFEEEYKNDRIVEELNKIGHNYSFVDLHGFAALTAISTAKLDDIRGSFDPRRPGEVAYAYN